MPNVAFTVVASVLETMHSPPMEGDQVVVLVDGGGVLVQEPEVCAEAILVVFDAVVQLSNHFFCVFNDYLHFFECIQDVGVCDVDVLLGVGAEFYSPGVGHGEEMLVLARVHILMERGCEAQVAGHNIKCRFVVVESDCGRPVFTNVLVVEAVMALVGKSDRGSGRE